MHVYKYRNLSDQNVFCLPMFMTKTFTQKLFLETQSFNLSHIPDKRHKNIFSSLGDEKKNQGS